MTCRVCKQDKPHHRFQSGICKECVAAYMKEWNAKNNDKACANKRSFYRKKRNDSDWVESEKARGREYWAKLKHEVFLAYGGAKCACCGETEEAFLSIDHVFNDGAKHRLEISKPLKNGKGRTGGTLLWLKNHNFPAGFQILCMNCNFGKSKNGGICPHKKPNLQSKTA